MRTRAARDSMNGWAQATPRAHAPRSFFYEWGAGKGLTRDCWGWLSLLQGPSLSCKEGWRLLFSFFLYEWRAAATAAAGSAARAVPPSSLREEVKATFTPLRTWVGTVRVGGGGAGDTATSGSWATSWVGEDTPRSRDFYPPQAVRGRGNGRTPARGILFL